MCEPSIEKADHFLHFGLNSWCSGKKHLQIQTQYNNRKASELLENLEATTCVVVFKSSTTQ